ncbi:MAG: selenocysteine-specific translation elongation factor [Candidatus Adiutrix sp.]|jgi:selenocysteine-specific elongation factor|nr:selenocysteine-specific translation elongation factor [Candidatus Adiutrix sp.]
MSKSKHAIIGTAGHVDHGKTALIKALTGIDTDRLAEEKKRGITIETGFAHLDLPGGRRAGVVDVPGHERFIKNMLAGAAGIDLAMLVVAADDGVMPQTREHLDILRLLNIPAGLVVLSKADLVDDDWLELVRDDLGRLTKGTFLEGAPVIPVSAHTGRGLEELKAALAALVSALKNREAADHFRLPFDRVFSMTGFGTVVTGTLMEGVLNAGETAMVYPAGMPVKIRGVQVHGQAVDSALPGQRVAVNLNIKRDKLERGDVLATLDSLSPTLMLDVRLEVLKNSPFPVKNGSWVHLYLSAREQLAKVVLMEEAELEEGRSAFAQLRMMEPLTARKGDRFVIRFYSPVITIGGGQVLDPAPLKRRRHKAQVISQFETKESGSPPELLELAIGERPETFPTLQELVIRAGLDPTRVRNDCHSLVRQGRIAALTRDVYIHQREMERLKAKLRNLLNDWHRKNPYSPGLSLEEARGRLAPGAPPAVTDALIAILENEKFIIREQGSLRLSGFQPQVNEAENELIDKLEQIYLSCGLTPLVTSAVEPAGSPAEERRRQAAFSALTRRGLIKRLDDSYYLHSTYYDQAWQRFQELAANRAVVQVGRFRDELQTSRKVAVALLEHFDKAGLTRPVGEGRTLRGS